MGSVIVEIVSNTVAMKGHCPFDATEGRTIDADTDAAVDAMEVTVAFNKVGLEQILKDVRYDDVHGWIEYRILPRNVVAKRIHVYGPLAIKIKTRLSIGVQLVDTVCQAIDSGIKQMMKVGVILVVDGNRCIADIAGDRFTPIKQIITLD